MVHHGSARVGTESALHQGTGPKGKAASWPAMCWWQAEAVCQKDYSWKSLHESNATMHRGDIHRI
jgi:hypothetical protein